MGCHLRTPGQACEVHQAYGHKVNCLQNWSLQHSVIQKNTIGDWNAPGIWTQLDTLEFFLPQELQTLVQTLVSGILWYIWKTDMINVWLQDPRMSTRLIRVGNAKNPTRIKVHDLPSNLALPVQSCLFFKVQHDGCERGRGIWLVRCSQHSKSAYFTHCFGSV